MKKFIKIISIILIMITICSCEKEKNRDGQLIEISAVELTNNFQGENAKSFIFAIINEHKAGYDTFEQDLRKLVKETGKTIYYTYYQHIDTDSALFIFNVYDAYFTSNAYHVVENNEMILTKMYTTYDQMKLDLQDIYLNDELVLQKDKEIKENLKLALEEYNKGNLAFSYNYLNRIWDSEEAKQFFDEHPYLGLIKSWEHFTLTNDKKPRITYRSMMFYHNANFFYETLVKEYSEGFEKPNDLSSYELRYYYIKDDIIYTSDKENGKYVERFKIKEISKLKVRLFDYKYKKEYVYDRRV